jgi:O-methyltransferase
VKDHAQIEAFRSKILELELAKLDGEPDSPFVDMMRTLLRERRVWVDGARMRSLRQRCERYAGVAGAFVECGVAMGGSLALMKAYAGPGRKVWGFDSFEAMPALGAHDGGDGAVYVGVQCAGDEGERAVSRTFELVGVSMDGVHVVRGWFDAQLPARCADIGAIALLRLDADWYDATRFCLETLYDQVIAGGAVIVDDYHTFRGCREAVDEFRSARAIDAPLIVTDPRSEVYWLKS